MAYNNLSQSTLDDSERREEATRIVKMILHMRDQMSEREAGFVLKMSDEDAWVSVKQLFWLRDLASKYYQ